MSSYREIALAREDSLLDIVMRIRESAGSHREIRLILGENPVFRTYLPVRLLQAVFPDRQFVFIVSDAHERRIGEPLGIRYYTRSDDIEFEREYTRTHILRHNFTFFEYLAYEAKKTALWLAFRYKKSSSRMRRPWLFSDANVVLLTAGLLVSVALLSFIVYFAVSKTFVYIAPELTVRTASRNLIYQEESTNEPGSLFVQPNSISVRRVEHSTYLEQTFATTVYDANTVKNASGTLLVINELDIEQIFRPKTRFITDAGIVYRSSDWIRIPAASTGTGGELLPGETSIRVVADIYDQDGEVTGVRGNIESGELLTIPGLQFNRDKIYARTVESFSWGDDPTVRIIDTEELERFQNIALEKVRLKAYEELKDSIARQNEQTGEEYAILGVDDIVRYSAGSVQILADAEPGSVADEVSIAADITVSAYAYDRRAARFYLQSIVNEMLLFGTEKLIAIDEDSLRITTVVSREGEPFTMKATTQLDATISYDFEDDSNALTQKLKNLILGTSHEEARSILLNNSNIANVHIDSSPFWLSSVVGDPDNIEFIIQR